MKILESYLELIEKEAYLISAAWKALQIICYFVIAVSGFAACISFSNFIEEFGGNCPLYASLVFEITNCGNDSLPESDRRPTFDNTKSQWSTIEECSFCQYAPVCAVIFSLLWAVLFTMCGRGGKTTQGLSQPWRIVYPALLFNFIYFIISTICAVKIDNGYSTFCDYFMKNMNETSCAKIEKYCMPKSTITDITVAQAASWINMIAWLFSVVWLLLRCFLVVDFQVIKVLVEEPEPEPEKEEKKPITLPAAEYENGEGIQTVVVLEQDPSNRNSKESISNV